MGLQIIYDPVLGKARSGDAVSYTAATKPAATDVAVGTVIWNSDTGKPEWSDGTDWLTLPVEFKGYFANEAAIIAAHPTGVAGWYCLNTDTNTVWFWDTDTNAWMDTAEGGLVTSVFGRVGDIVATTNDYTWAQIDKSTSSIADITTKKANLLDWALSADLEVSAGNVVFNSGSGDYDFTIKKNTSGDAFVYDAGADTLTMSASTIDINGVEIGAGVAGGSILSLTPFSSDPATPQANDCWILDTGSARYFKYYDGSNTYSVELTT